MSVKFLAYALTDDGCGFDADAAQHGHGLGLISMQERLKLVNGHITIESKVGAGTAVRASVPLRTRSADGAPAVIRREQA